MNPGEWGAAIGGQIFSIREQILQVMIARG
jgi:hypothetical protein